MPMWTVTGIFSRYAAASTLRRACAGRTPRRWPGRALSPSPRPSLTPLRDGVVHAAGLFPQAELAGRDVAGDALGAGADQGELPVVDRPGAVHGDERDQPALHQVDEVPLRAGAQDVRAHHQDAGRPALPSPRRSRWPMSGMDGWANVDGRVERLEDVEREIVLPLRERLEAELRAVELGEGHLSQE